MLRTRILEYTDGQSLKINYKKCAVFRIYSGTLLSIYFFLMENIYNYETNSVQFRGTHYASIYQPTTLSESFNPLGRSSVQIFANHPDIKLNLILPRILKGSSCQLSAQVPE